MKTTWTTQAVSCVFALFLFITACGDRGSEQPTPLPKVIPQSGAHRITAIQVPASVQSRLRIAPVAAHMVPDVVTAPGEVALDLNQVAKIMSRIEGQVEKIHVQLGDRVKPCQPLAAIGSLQLDQLIEELCRRARRVC